MRHAAHARVLIPPFGVIGRAGPFSGVRFQGEDFLRPTS